MREAIEIIEKMIRELESQCQPYYPGSNYSETHDKIDLLNDVIVRLNK